MSCWVSRASRRCPRYQEFSIELAASVIDEAARFAQDVLAPINRSRRSRSGRAGPDGAVSSAGEFRSAYRQYVDGGWPQLATDAEHRRPGRAAGARGRGRGDLASAPTSPSCCARCCRAVRSMRCEVAASPAAAGAIFLPKMISGEWTGTMNLTEPQAGSDLGAIRTRAAPEGDHYRITRPEDLHHLRRARPDREHRAPGAGAHRRRAGGRQGHLAVRGAEVLVNADGSLGAAQRRALRVDRAQARHPRQPDLRDGLRRSRRRDRLPGRRGRIAASSTCSS